MSTPVLIIPGAAAVLVGLFVWLGGLAFKKAIVAILGAIVGGIAGYIFIDHNIIPAAASAVVVAAVVVLIERIFIAIIAAALAAAFGFAVLAGPYINTVQAENPANQDEISAQTTAATSVDESIERLKAFALDVGEKIKKAGSLMPLQRWAMIAVLAAIFIVGGFYLRRLTPALCCSVLGTVFIFVGMILLLLYKGTAPVSRICSNPLIYAAVFAAMAAFGTVEQLLICRRPKVQPAEAGNKRAVKAKGKVKKKGTEQPQKGWRTS